MFTVRRQGLSTGGAGRARPAREGAADTVPRRGRAAPAPCAGRPGPRSRGIGTRGGRVEGRRTVPGATPYPRRRRSAACHGAAGPLGS
ncbi:hypothetical protein GCM10009551_032660 [Nocardiopsis tropica]